MNLAVPFPPHPHLPAAGPASNTELLWRCGTRGTLWAGCESEIRAQPGESRLGHALMPRGQLVALTNVSLETLCDSQPPPAFSSSNYGTNTNKQTLTASLPSSLPPSFPLGFSPVPLCLRKVSRRAGAPPVVRDGAGQCPNPGGRCSRDVLTSGPASSPQPNPPRFSIRPHEEPWQALLPPPQLIPNASGS